MRCSTSIVARGLGKCSRRMRLIRESFGCLSGLYWLNALIWPNILGLIYVDLVNIVTTIASCGQTSVTDRTTLVAFDLTGALLPALVIRIQVARTPVVAKPHTGKFGSQTPNSPVQQPSFASAAAPLKT